MRDGLIGMIDTPKQGSRAVKNALHDADVTWCADNGAFTNRWNETSWWAWLTHPDQLTRAATCLFATAPDVVGDAAATHVRAAPWLPKIRALGYPAAYVAQDGLEQLTVPWDDFDVLFIGGTTTWKLGPHPRALAHEARMRGKRVHMGRVNSQRRYRYALAIGCDSADGTKLVFGPDVNLPHVLAWARLTRQGTLIDALEADAQDRDDA